MNYYSYYQQCNQNICVNLICTTYLPECGQNAYWPDLNRYFACQPICPGYLKSSYPDILFVGYSLGIAAAISFAIFVVVPIVMGIIFNVKAK